MTAPPTARRSRMLIACAIALATAMVVAEGLMLGLTATAGRSTCPEHVQARLFFGLSTPTGRVSDSEWVAFLADAVTPRFPSGLTVVEANGQWRAPGRTDVTREPSQIVEIVDGGADMDRRIDEIVAIYRERFHQDSVMLTRGRVEVCF